MNFFKIKKKKILSISICNIVRTHSMKVHYTLTEFSRTFVYFQNHITYAILIKLCAFILEYYLLSS